MPDPYSIDRLLGSLMEAVENLKRTIERHDGDFADMRRDIRDVIAQVSGLRSEVADIKKTLADMQIPVSSFVNIREKFSNLWWVAGLGITALGTVVGPALYDAMLKFIGKK